MVYRVVDKYIGGKGYELNNLIEDTQYKKQSNTADFVHHVINKGFPWQIRDGKPYGSPEGAAAGALVDTDAPVSWEEWLLASPGGALWAEWKDRIQADRNTIQEVFDVDTQTYTRTIDYDSEGNYNKLRDIYKMGFGDTFYSKIESEETCRFWQYDKTEDLEKYGNEDTRIRQTDKFAHVDPVFDKWRRDNRGSRKHIKIAVYKGNV